MDLFQTVIDNIFYQKALEKISSSQNLLTPQDLNNLDIKNELKNSINENSVINLEDIHTFEQLENLNGNLVKYKCMIQNIFNPEIYGSLVMADKNNNISPGNVKEKLFYLKYRDFYENPVFEHINLEENSILEERLPIYCIPIPGVNNESGMKEKQIEENLNEMKLECDIVFKGIEIVKSKNIRCYSQHLKKFNVWNSFDLNHFPCLAKFYDSFDQIKLNEVIEIYGILQYNINAENEKFGAVTQDENYLENLNVTFPNCLIPRIHCIYFKKINLYETDVISAQTYEARLHKNISLENDLKICELLLSQLTHITNDLLVSKYILFNLINIVKPQKKTIDQIKLSLNIFKIANQNLNLQKLNRKLPVQSILSRFLGRILPRCVFSNLNINNLDNEKYFPIINYDSNNLEVGLFQVASPTFVVIDETTMNSGVLKENGIRNVQAINELVENDVISFNFSYQDIKIDCDCYSIVFSDGKSFLKTNLHIPLFKDEQHKENLDESLEGLLYFEENPEIFELFKYYLIRCKENLKNITFSQELAKEIEEDYINERKTEKNNLLEKVEPEDLHQWIILSKILAVSKGKTTLTTNEYLEAKYLEKQRIKRLIHVNFKK